jgi:hypothetical protein
MPVDSDGPLACASRERGHRQPPSPPWTGSEAVPWWLCTGEQRRQPGSGCPDHRGRDPLRHQHGDLASPMDGCHSAGSLLNGRDTLACHDVAGLGLGPLVGFCETGCVCRGLAITNWKRLPGIGIHVAMQWRFTDLLQLTTLLVRSAFVWPLARSLVAAAAEDEAEDEARAEAKASVLWATERRWE